MLALPLHPASQAGPSGSHRMIYNKFTPAPPPPPTPIASITKGKVCALPPRLPGRLLSVAGKAKNKLANV